MENLIEIKKLVASGNQKALEQFSKQFIYGNVSYADYEEFCKKFASAYLVKEIKNNY